MEIGANQGTMANSSVLRFHATKEKNNIEKDLQGLSFKIQSCISSGGEQAKLRDSSLAPQFF